MRYRVLRVPRLPWEWLLWTLILSPLVVRHLARSVQAGSILTSLVACFLAFQLLNQMPFLSLCRELFRLPPTLISLGIASIAILIHSPWLAMTCVLIELAVRLISLRRLLGWRRILCAWGLLTWTVPWPLDLNSGWNAVLQGCSVTIASRMLDLAGVLHLPEGHSVLTAQRQYWVEDACSGAQMLSIVAAVTLFGIGRWPLSFSNAVGLVVGVVVWSCLGSGLRVCMTTWLAETASVNSLEDPWHSLLGIVSFVLVLTILVSQAIAFEWLRVRLRIFLSDSVEVLSPRCELLSFSDKSVDSAATQRPSRSLARWAALIVLLALQLMVGLYRSQYLNSSDHEQASIQSWSLGSSARGSAESRIDLDPEWQFASFPEDQAHPSHVIGAAGQHELREPLVELSGPFPGWHDLVNCYRAAGWSVDSWRSREHQERRWDEVRMTHPRRGQATLLFALVHADGSSLNSAHRISWNAIRQSIIRRLTRSNDRFSGDAYWQLQYCVPQEVAERDAIAEQFLGFWDRSLVLLRDPEAGKSGNERSEG